MPDLITTQIGIHGSAVCAKNGFHDPRAEDSKVIDSKWLAKTFEIDYDQAFEIRKLMKSNGRAPINTIIVVLHLTYQQLGRYTAKRHNDKLLNYWIAPKPFRITGYQDPINEAKVKLPNEIADQPKSDEPFPDTIARLDVIDASIQSCKLSIEKLNSKLLNFVDFIPGQRVLVSGTIGIVHGDEYEGKRANYNEIWVQKFGSNFASCYDRMSIRALPGCNF